MAWKPIALMAGAIALSLSACDGSKPVEAEKPEPQEAASPHPLQLITMKTFGGKEAEGFHDCFWIGPVSYESYNIAYPDEGAVYWGTKFQLPEGASHLLIEGLYPKARYFSYNTYDIQTQPIHGIADLEITPSEGANPYSDADKSGGKYAIKVVNGAAPEEKAANTLYLGTEEQRNKALPIILRIYLPETPGDFTGGAGLPSVSLVMADGNILRGTEMCQAVKSPAPGTKERSFPTVVIEKDTYLSLINDASAHKGFPAWEETKWTKFWGGDVSISRYIPDQKYYDDQIAKAVSGEREIRSGFYANAHNQYISAFTNETFGNVLVLKGRMPTTPKSGWDTTAGDYDMRYWSLCTNEHIVTTRYADCRYDHQVALDENRDYTIVISKEANRPANARAECGVTWIDWGENGDGAGDTSQGNLILRNMLGDGFEQSIQNVSSPIGAAEEMGAYFPKTSYTTKSDFEALGCSASE